MKVKFKAALITTNCHPISIPELIDKRGLKPMKAILESLGGWPVLEGKNWAENTWFWQKLLLKLHLGGFNSNYLFFATIDVDMKNSSKRVISVSNLLPFLMNLSH